MKTAMSEFDLLIKEAKIFDGTSNPFFIADIGIQNGTIVSIQKKLPSTLSRRTIMADGLAVCPGFIDPHSHDDGYLLVNPRCEEKVLQGVTTEIIGNCGFSLAPCLSPHREEWKSIFIGGAHLPESAWTYFSFADYLDTLQKIRPALNVGTLVGHHALRVAVMGVEDRAPDSEELARMKALVAQSMEDGVFGLSTGLVYAPGMYATTEEIIELAFIVGRHNGLYATHMRSEGDRVMEAIDEVIYVGRQAGLPVHISHHKTMGRNNWGRSTETIARITLERRLGLEITCDLYPYTAGSTYLAAVLPPSLQSGGPEIFGEKLKDPEVRRSTIEEIETSDNVPWENLIKADTFEGMVISFSNKHKDYIGKSIATIAAEENKDPYDVVFDLIVDEKTDVQMIEFAMDEVDVIRIMQAPYAMIGSDGLPGFGSTTVHPRFTGTFPRILGFYAREKGALSFEDAIRKMTSLPAQAFQINNKGLIKEGFDADLVVLNPDTVIDTSDYSDSSGKPKGISWVIVNGEVAVEHGQMTDIRAGKVLRHTYGKMRGSAHS